MFQIRLDLGKQKQGLGPNVEICFRFHMSTERT